MENKIAHRIIKNSFWSFLGSVVNRIGALIFGILLARFLLPEKYGIYSIVFAIIMIFYTFADLGVSQALVRYVSSALSENKKKIFPYHIYLLKVKAILVLTVSLILALAAYPLSFYVFKNPAFFLPLLIGFFYLIIQSFQSFYGNLFFSAEKAQYYSIKESINQTLKIIFVFFVFYFVASNYQVLGIFLSLILCSSVLLLFNLTYIRKVIPELFIRSDLKIEKRILLKFIGFLTLASISSAFFSYADSLILGLFLPLEYVGYYRAAFSLIIGVWGLISFPVAIMFPVFTKLKIGQVEHIFNSTIRYLSAATIPLILGMIVLGREFITLLYGQAYLPSYFALVPLSLIVFLGAYVDYSTSVFSAKEKPQLFAKLIIFVSLLNIVLNLVLINLFLLISPIWATFGAALGTTTSWVVYVIAATLMLKKHFGIKVSFRHLLKPLISGAIMSGSLIFLLKVMPINILSLIFAVLLGTVIYFICMLIIHGIEKKDLKIVKSILKNEKSDKH